jgi:hypothetical protein
MHVKDLTTDELKALIRETVLEVMEELLPDPDAGLTVKPEIQQSLIEIRHRRATTPVGIPAEEVVRRLELS